MIRWLILGCVICLSGCGGDDSNGNGNDSDVELVNEFDTETYVYTYRATGFAPNDPWQIQVQDGEAVAVQYVGSDEPDLEVTPETAPTIEDLLVRIENCHSSSSCDITELNYDGMHHYPTEFYGDQGGEGNGFVISDFYEGMGGVSFHEFSTQVSEATGESPVNCGIVDVGEEGEPVNTCVDESFAAEQPFYAIYRQNSVESGAATAIVMGEDGEVQYWTSGGESSLLPIQKHACPDAALTGNTTGGWLRIFICNYLGDLEIAAAEAAGAEAVDCGTVNIGQDVDATNACVAEHHASETPFFAVYEKQPTDSTVGAAIAMNADAEVTYWHYDSNPSGGPPGSEAVLEEISCEQANIAARNPEVEYPDILRCEQSDP